MILIFTGENLLDNVKCTLGNTTKRSRRVSWIFKVEWRMSRRRALRTKFCLYIITAPILKNYPWLYRSFASFGLLPLNAEREKNDLVAVNTQRKRVENIGFYGE